MTVSPDQYAAMFQPFPGSDDLIDRTTCPAGLVESVQGRVGTSRCRVKAGADAFRLLHSLSARFQPVPMTAVEVLRLVLRPGRIGPVPADSFADDGEVEQAALVVIDGIRRGGVVDRLHRRAAFVLIAWHVAKSLVVPVVAVNAFALSAGVLCADNGQPNDVAIIHLMSHAPGRIRKHAQYDAEALAGPDAKRRSVAEHVAKFNAAEVDFGHFLGRMRASPTYRRIERNRVRELTAEARLQSQYEQLALMVPDAFARRNRT